MAIKYLYKCNPKVAAAAGVTAFDRYTWPDGTFLLWQNDLVKIDRVQFFLEQDELLADLGAVKMTDPEAAAEQKDPAIRLPEARLPQYRWEQPDLSVKTDNGDTEGLAGDTDQDVDQPDRDADGEGGEA